MGKAKGHQARGATACGATGDWRGREKWEAGEEGGGEVVPVWREKRP